MKNKRNTYILLFLVLIIWGAVIYRFFNLTDDTEVLPEESVFLSTKETIIKERKPNIINTNYRDPFLGRVYSGNSAGIVSHKARKRAHKEVLPILLPDFVYKGLVSDSKNKNKVFMVLINGHTYLLREKDTEEGITIIKGNSTEIFILFNEKKYTIGIK